ncbi:hypothetical protein [Embleya sp. NPDC050493]|uniref:hypothetical protein n=1 Tax=Embleya sp. NPDC050493 TaxID=3363989 RepID=UPI00379674F0
MTMNSLDSQGRRPAAGHSTPSSPRTGMRIRARLLLAVTASALVLGAALPVSPAAAAGAPGDWTAAQLPADGVGVSLTGITKPDAHTTWAAGFRITDGGPFTPVLYARDDRRGGTWAELPTAPEATGRVNAVASTSPRDAWMVGDASENTGDPITTQHWNGRSWTVRYAPMPPNSQGGGLLSVAERTPNDVWAAGWVQLIDKITPDPDGGPPQYETHDEGIVQHWNGRAWTRVALPQPTASWALNSISVSGPNDIWAVGNGFGDNDKPLALHYDGHAWRVVPVPEFGGVWGEFNAVVAYGPSDVWAVGRRLLDDEDSGHALVMHWNGRSWTPSTPPPDAGPMYGATRAPAGIVAVGATVDRENGYGLRITASRAASLDIPAPSADGRSYLPWSVHVDRGTVTAVGISTGPARPLAGLVLTGRP